MRYDVWKNESGGGTTSGPGGGHFFQESGTRSKPFFTFIKRHSKHFDPKKYDAMHLRNGQIWRQVSTARIRVAGIVALLRWE